MSQENMLKMLSGASAVARNSAQMMSNKTAEILEEKVLRGKYVTREEYDQLRKLVAKLQKEIEQLKTAEKK